jgi:hypothetical protein
MEQIHPTVMPEEVWNAIRNMGRAVVTLGEMPISETQEPTLLLVFWRWMDVVEALEAWTGPNDVEGVERWPDEVEGQLREGGPDVF